MYSVELFDGKVNDADGFSMISNTVYTNHANVSNIQLWIKAIMNDNGERVRQVKLIVFYNSKEKATLSWTGFDPVYIKSGICISTDGTSVFIPVYDKGIFVINVHTNTVIYKYSIKHIFQIAISENSLLCLHRENRRQIVRIDYPKESAEEMTSSCGTRFFLLNDSCILYKKNEKTYIVADSHNFTKSITIPISDFGSFIGRFDILSALYCKGRINIKYMSSDATDRTQLTEGSCEYICSENLTSFIEALAAE